MGISFTDKYSILHFAVGVIFRHFAISLPVSVGLHIVFEFTENTEAGMSFINKYFKGIWPGGKTHSDSGINSVGDTVYFALGWIVADLILRDQT